MKTIRITNAELAMIEQHRQSIKHKKATDRFRKEVLKLAFEFKQYLEREHMHPSFSEFINCFDPPASNINKLKYEAVKSVFDAVNSIEIPKNFNQLGA
ncbi:hypothetical protein [Acinetobacter gerneri]|uniref:Uncharacterized protein n=1 Tax=Acinetobacter gerneri DSM 14967 = CIP 107464 = MTCC 9824 TaxID=1120926 RepID=N8ZQD3_9GAMM|nr:hypothetical protein [Acinetobacter gerneri]ENV33953.1 hypothetical protein F960_01959 [Acinetobacter gerneri DSM 14967 = CIP 107464 = MTCC 9824]MDV2438672.1 hypothetical protein [Acinetobacter gerneri]